MSDKYCTFYNTTSTQYFANSTLESKNKMLETYNSNLEEKYFSCIEKLQEKSIIYHDK